MRGDGRRLGLAVCLFAASACAPSIQPARMRQVGGLAVVAFDARQVGPQRGGLFFNPFDRRPEERCAAQAYRQMAESLEHQFGWKVLPRAEVASNELYAGYTREYQTDNPFARAPPGRPVGPNLLLDDIMWDLPASRIEGAHRVELMQDLGVDAIALIWVKLSPADVSRYIDRGGKYEAEINIEVFDQHDDEPIWADSASGEEGDKIKCPGVFDPRGCPNEEGLCRGVLRAIESARHELFKRYRAKHWYPIRSRQQVGTMLGT